MQTWKVNNMLLNSEWVNNEIKEEIKRHLETNENEDTKVQNLWYTGKEILRRKLIALQAYLKKPRKTLAGVAQWIEHQPENQKKPRKSSNTHSNFTLKGT